MPKQLSDLSVKLLVDMSNLDLKIAALNSEAREMLRRMTVLELEAAALVLPTHARPNDNHTSQLPS